MYRLFDEELELLNAKIIHMGILAEEMVHNVLTGLKKHDKVILNKVFIQETEVNNLHLEIDGLCLKLLALRQPLACDLRFISAGMKINSELERIGDQAVNILQNTLEFIKQPGEIPDDIDKMIDIVKNMVRGSLEAFLRRDPDLAKETLLKDDEADELKTKIFRELLVDYKCDDTPLWYFNQTFDLILISRNLERIADHATNICEDVIFIVLGKDVRHHQLDCKNNF